MAGTGSLQRKSLEQIRMTGRCGRTCDIIVIVEAVGVQDARLCLRRLGTRLPIRGNPQRKSCP